MGSSCGCCYKSQRVCSSAPLSRLRSAPSSFTPPSLPSPLLLPSGWPCVLGCPPVPPYNEPATRGAQRVPVGAGGVCVVVRLSLPVLRIALRWPRGSGDDPPGCA